jgi:Tfp pilus assembly pilus retraction ATPase PilT
MSPRPALARSFAGDIDAISLFDLAQFLLISQKTGTLRVETGGRRAQMRIIDGQIVNATDDARSEGVAAAHRILSWRKGSFEFTVEAVVIDGTSRIMTPTDALLLEFARKSDNAPDALGTDGAVASGATREAGPENDDPGPTEAAFLAKQYFARELADLFGALDTELEDEIDFRKDIPIETLLGAVIRRGAGTLFLRDGEVPKARGPRGLFPLGQVPITRRVIDRIAAAFLGGSEKLVLLEMRDRVVREHLVEGVGYVRLEMIQEEDLRRAIVTILEPEAPPLASFGLDPSRIAETLRARRGLLLVAAPARGGKSSFCAALATAASGSGGRHVVIFEESRRYRLREERGVIEHCDLGRAEGSADALLDQVWRRKADVLVIDAVRRASQMEGALAAASGALVIAALDGAGAPDAIARFLAMSVSPERSARAAEFADAFLGAIALPNPWPAPPGSAPSCELLMSTPQLVDAMRSGDTRVLAELLRTIESSL